MPKRRLKMENITEERLRSLIYIEDGLRKLDLSNQTLKEVPPALIQVLTRLTELEELNLSNNQPNELPESIAEIKQLTVLYLHNNKLSVLPDTFSQLKKLRLLDLSGNQLTALPDVIGELEELEWLFVKNNKLSVLPDTFSQLKKLWRLYLSGNQLTALPDAIGELKELEWLYVRNNKLSVLPDTFSQLKKLWRLYLSGNQLTALPDAIGELKELEVLHVDNNKLSVLPDTFSQLKKLSWLNLSGNQLTALPDVIGELKELKWLDVDDNPLTLEGRRKVVKIQDRIKYGRDEAAYVRQQTAEGRRAQDAYEKALKDGFVYVNRAEIKFVGQDRAGKTSLKKSLLGQPFDRKEQSTEGIEVNSTQCEIEVEQVKNWRSTQEKETGLIERSKYDIARIVTEKLCQIDFEEKSDSDSDSDSDSISTDENNYQMDQVEENLDQSKKPDSSSSSAKAEVPDEGSVNNGKHLIDSQIGPDEPDVTIDIASLPADVRKHVHQCLNYVKGEGDKSSITIEEDVISMDLWDFAGQHMYYASHPLFLSRRALYVLVHNLSKVLHAPAQPCVRQGACDKRLENSTGETNLENLLSWLATIHSMAEVKEQTDGGAQGKLSYVQPPVIIVGTHADKPAEDIAKMNEQIRKGISGKEYEKHVVRPFFSIDNTISLVRTKKKRFFGLGSKKAKHQKGQDVHIKRIQELRNRIMEVLREQPNMEQKIPVRWFLFEKVIEALVAKQIYHSTLKQLLHYAEKNCFLRNADEFDAMISFYHDHGMIIRHRNTVVLKSQWLIELLKQLITIPHYDKMKPIDSKYWKQMEDSGILSKELVDRAFSKFIQQGLVKDDILDMMEQFGLIAKFAAPLTDVKYFVPCQLKSSPEELCKMEPSDNDPCPLYLHFLHGFVPHGLFSQLVSRSIRWCCETWSGMPLPNLYQNGAWFVIGKQIHDFILICKKSFVKIVLRQRKPSHQVSAEKSEELASLVRGFVEQTLQSLPEELPYLSKLQYQWCVACPYCHQGADQECSNHGKLSCVDEECFHLLEVQQDEQLICMRKVSDEVRTVPGMEKWFLNTTSQELTPSSVTDAPDSEPADGKPERSDTVLRVTLLASEWSSSMGGLSTINRQLATLLAKHKQVEVTLLVPQFACSEEEMRAARSHNVAIKEAERRPGYEKLDWLSFPPKDLAIDVVLGHGAKLGKQAQVIREYHHCKWVQVVHTAPEELGMHKDYSKAIAKGEEKNRIEVDLCKLSNLVVAVGPKLAEAYSSYLRSCEEHQDVIQLTPSTFHEFSDVKQARKDSDKFKVLTFGRGDPEDFSLKGYDIAARAIVELNDRSYRLIFVGAPDGKQDEVADNLLKSGISKDQLTVRKFVTSKERLKELFCEADVAIMPSRTEGFGLTALEALSAGLPILVSGNSGFGDALRGLPLGKPLVVDSNEPKDWADAIRAVRQKDRAERLEEVQRLKTCYEERYSWDKQCDDLVEKMLSLVQDQCQVSRDSTTDHEQMTSEALLSSGQCQVSRDSTTDHEQMTSEALLSSSGQCQVSRDSTTDHEQMTSEALLSSSDLPRQMFQTLQQMQQHSASKVNSQTDPSAELKNIASDKGFVIIDNQGSGNCLFHALVDQLELVKGIKISHEELRQSVVQFLRENPQTLDGTDLFNFVDGYQSWDGYLSNMAQNGTWGDHVIVYAAANCYDTCIHVISSLPQHQDLTVTPDRQTDSSKPLVLGHVHELHYVSLQPKQD